MGVKTFRKVASIDAMQWTGLQGSTAAIISWARKHGVDIFVDFDYSHDEFGVRVLRIPTLEGPMQASVGDYVAKGVDNEFWAIKPDIMEKTYEEVE